LVFRFICYNFDVIIITMADLQSKEQNKIKNDIDARYLDYVNGLILFRLQLIVSIGIVLHLAFFAIDRIAYPANASTFLKIRLIAAFALLILIFISFSKKVKPHIVWLADAAGIIFIISMGSMVFISNGSSSRYYEGANLVFIGMSIIIPFYMKHLICNSLIWIGFFEVAMIFGHGKFNLLNFDFANYFMSSTALLVVIMTKFYKDQHYNAYVRQEQLKINEKTLSDLYTQADKLSKTDTLTEINNRRHFSDMLNKKIRNCESAKTSFYLVIFDVDHFKEINDSYGHTLGDRVLVKVVEVVKNNIRSSDFVGRYGGDEFIICLDFPNKEGILNRLTKIRDGVKALSLTHDGKEVHISVSIGAAKFIPGTNMTEKNLIEKADFELFNVKKTTRGEISVNE